MKVAVLAFGRQHAVLDAAVLLISSHAKGLLQNGLHLDGQFFAA